MCSRNSSSVDLRVDAAPSTEGIGKGTLLAHLTAPCP